MARPVHEFETYLHSMELQRGQDWDTAEYPYGLPAVRGWDKLAFHPHVTFFVGENGSGKSTLIEAIAAAYGLNPEGGSRDHRYSTQATHSPLHNHVRLVKSTRRAKDAFFLRAESFYTFSTFIDAEGNRSRMGGHALHELSHGQSFTALIENRFNGSGLYILDEPEAALSPNRQLGFLARLHELVGQKSQFIIATHSPIILAYPNATIYELSPSGLLPTAYDDLEHVQVTRNFLNRTKMFLDTLLADDDEADE
ncbi:MAG: AAA family ATPase [Hyphomonadaceae bacterium]|nr:AAA family ATPase [Hyphomonadaceae bacterium]